MVHLCTHTHTIHTHTHTKHTDRVDFNSTCSYISARFKTENPLRRFPNPSLTTVAHPSHQMRKQAVDFRNQSETFRLEWGRSEPSWGVEFGKKEILALLPHSSAALHSGKCQAHGLLQKSLTTGRSRQEACNPRPPILARAITSDSVAKMTQRIKASLGELEFLFIPLLSLLTST